VRNTFLGKAGMIFFGRVRGLCNTNLSGYRFAGASVYLTFLDHTFWHTRLERSHREKKEKKGWKTGVRIRYLHPCKLLYIHRVRVRWLLISVCASSAGLENHGKGKGVLFVSSFGE
jgi:hypothetical protein